MARSFIQGPHGITKDTEKEERNKQKYIKVEKYDIFISYRRTSFKTANLVASRLKSAGHSVFIDTESMHSGKFDSQLFTRIENCKDFVLILTPDTLDRCYDENDWVRKEILHAIKFNKNIIPVLFKNFTWPETLPSGMQGLDRYQSLPIEEKPEQYNWAIDQLNTRYLKSKARRRGVFIWILVIVILALLGFIFFLLNNKQAGGNEAAGAKSDTVQTDTTVKENAGSSQVQESAPAVPATPVKVEKDEVFEAGVKAMRAGNGVEAIKLFTESGSAASLQKIGVIYTNGCGTVEKNEMMADKYFKMAKKAGYGAE